MSRLEARATAAIGWGYSGKGAAAEVAGDVRVYGGGRPETTALSYSDELGG